MMCHDDTVIYGMRSFPIIHRLWGSQEESFQRVCVLFPVQEGYAGSALWQALPVADMLPKLKTLRHAMDAASHT